MNKEVWILIEDNLPVGIHLTEGRAKNHEYRRRILRKKPEGHIKIHKVQMTNYPNE